MRKLIKLVIIVCVTLLLIPTTVLVAIIGWFIWPYEYEMDLPGPRELAAISTASPVCSSGRERSYALLTDIPPIVRSAFLAVVEPDFYERPRINPFVEFAAALLGRRPRGSPMSEAIARCLIQSSTKCCKNQLDWHVATVVVLRRVESALTKDIIFELYLNETWFNRRAFGVRAAADAYFGKSLSDLALDEVAYIAALSKDPSLARRNNERGAHLRNWVIDRMENRGIISAAQAASAKQEPLQLREVSSPI